MEEHLVHELKLSQKGCSYGTTMVWRNLEGLTDE
jgi:hypothetical protein